MNQCKKIIREEKVEKKSCVKASSKVQTPLITALKLSRLLSVQNYYSFYVLNWCFGKEFRYFFPKSVVPNVSFY